MGGGATATHADRVPLLVPETSQAQIAASGQGNGRDTAAAVAALGARYPAVVSAYDDLRAACAGAGPLDRATVALVKLATSIGLNSDRGVHAHARKALAAGVDPDALHQVARVALPTAGLPAALDALRWIDEIIEERGR